MKFFYIPAILLTLSMGFASCNNEEDDIFDDSAANRLTNAVKDYTDKLAANGGKWEMRYFANGDEEGYEYIMTFNADGSVQMSADNSVIGGYKTEASNWEVIADYGPVLSFNTYNSIFHEFADPAVIVSGTAIDGKGHEGDYEFRIQSIEGDTAVLVGKKRGIEVLMTRLPSATVDETWFGELSTLKSTAFSSSIPYLVLTTSTGKRFIVSDASTSVWSAYPEGGDEITETSTLTSIITPSGVRFITPMTFLQTYDPEANAVQTFSFQSDGSLLGEDGLTTVKSPELYLMITSGASWRFDGSNAGGEWATLYENLVAGFKSYNNSTLQSVQINSTTSGYQLQLTSIRSGRTSRYTYPLTITTVDDNTVTFAFGEGIDNNSLIFARNIAAINEFMTGLTGTIKLSATSAIAPTTITLTSSSNASNYIAVNIR